MTVIVMRIAIVYNARPTGIARKDPKLERHIEGDEWKTIEAIGKAIIHNGHKVKYVAVDKNIFDKLQKLKSKIDLVFNLAEGLTGTSDREAQVPMLCEILGIPYTGPTPLSAALILNKYRAKQVWQSVGVPTASSQIFSSSKEKLNKKIKFPLIVKPNSDGSGIGIHNTSIVKNKKELVKAVKKVVNKYEQEALVETYLEGREFTVAIVGNKKDFLALPIIEINFAAFPKGSAPIDSYEAKFIYGATGQAVETEFCPADIPKKLENEIVQIAKDAYIGIGCRDFGRVDIRLDSKGKPFVLEINYPPGLMSDPDESSFFTISARTYGWSFSKLIGSILETAKTRLNLK